LTYHEVLPDNAGVDAWTVVRESDFVRQIESLRRWCAIISLDEALALGPAGRARARAAVITLDDGYAGARTTVLPIAEALGVPFTVFIATQAVESGAPYWFDRVICALLRDGGVTVDLSGCGLDCYRIPGGSRAQHRWGLVQRVLEDLKGLSPSLRAIGVRLIENQTQGPACFILRPLSVEDVGALSRSRYVTIGAHSHCHSRLVQLGAHDLERTLKTSRDLLEQWTGRPVRHFAYPNGDYDARVIAAVRSMGFDTGLTVRPGRWRDQDAMEVPRLGVGRYDSAAKFRRRTWGLPR
jgi:peptidoglycan/xylan/chitin deacetylase (PgdA/CDA1 family)